MRRRFGLIVSVCGLGGSVVLAGCAVQPPTGPTVMALPAPGKSLQDFEHEDYYCRDYAERATAYQSPGQPGSNPTATGAVVGTLGGAALGAALGAVAGNAGAGAAIGGATGLIGGAAVGNAHAAGTQYSMQQTYDIAYTQCMYSYGNSVRSPPPGYSYGGGPLYAYGYGYPYVGFPSFFWPNIYIGGGGGWGGGWGGWHGGGGGWHGGWGGGGGGGWHH